MKIKSLLFLPLMLAGCREAQHEAKPIAQEAPVAVHVATATAQQWPSVYEATGTIRARTSVAIAAKWMGYVREVKVKTGDRVQAGQVLITLDSRDLDSNVRRSEAALAEVRSAIPEADSGVAGAKAGLDLAQATFNRMQDLWNKKSISNQEFDEASAKLKASQAAYEMARARRSQIDAQAARVQQEIRSTEVARSYAEVTAPFSGVVIAKSVDPGVLAVPGAPLLTIERDGNFRLETAVEESRLGSIRVGQPVMVSLDTVDHDIEARVSEIVPVVDPASRSYTVKIDLPASAGLRSGIFGRAKFSLGVRIALTVALDAITQRGQLQSVVVIDKGVAHTRLITTGERVKGQVEVLSGLSDGEKVAAPTPQGLADGGRVEVRQ